MNRITGRSAFLALLRDEGITHLFGNPGTTELPIMHALKDHPDLTYVMAMQESLVVAIADILKVSLDALFGRSVEGVNDKVVALNSLRKTAKNTLFRATRKLRARLAEVR